ncbi:MAG: ABC transporter permease [Chloroflexota bacterium]|nr:ABC transporter permease [Chloroflexota bacterium]
MLLRLLRSEFYRLTRRWMPWILLAFIVVIAFLFYFLIYVSVNAQLQAIKSGTIPAPPGGTEQLDATLRQIAPDRVAEFGVGLVAGLGGVMLIVFAASHVGTEFGWGTFRTLLAHGASRSGFLVSKAVSLLLYALAFMIVGTLAAIGASYTVSAVAGISAGGGIDLAEVARVAGKSAYTFVPYMALALAISVWSKSAGAGIAAGLVVYFAEGLVATILVSLNKDYAQIVNWGLSRNASALTRTAGGPAAQDPTASTLPDATQAAIVLAVYTAIFLALAYWRLRSRDVTVGG